MIVCCNVVVIEKDREDVGLYVICFTHCWFHDGGNYCFCHIINQTINNNNVSRLYIQNNGWLNMNIRIVREIIGGIMRP